MENSSAPTSPTVPQIRITFPDEMDKKTGRPQSGGVVVVRLGENDALGLEPVHEQLPQYEKQSTGFTNMDLEKIGGLKEAPVYR